MTDEETSALPEPPAGPSQQDRLLFAATELVERATAFLEVAQRALSQWRPRP